MKSISHSLKKMVHKKCRNTVYPFSNTRRLNVADEEVSWDVNYPDYNPPFYESPILKNKPWADPAIGHLQFHPKWNLLDGNVNRKSHSCTYTIIDKMPVNPQGRTGLTGRGVLGKWGPNHAADPIVTRWKRNGDGEKVLHILTKLTVLQFCAIQRHDNSEWAIPGGMVDPGENVSETLKREFAEEVLNALGKSQQELERDQEMITAFFKNGVDIYKGYVDDPRNTDNAWMETVAMNFHDESGSSVGKFPLVAGDDAKDVRWIDIDKNLKLYASHIDFIQIVVKNHNAHW